MPPKAFKQWRKSLGLSQKGAAKALGLKTRIVQYYEKGEREGKKVEVPLSVRLACWALAQGVGDFDGSGTEPFEPDEKTKRKKAKKAEETGEDAPDQGSDELAAAASPISQ